MLSENLRALRLRLAAYEGGTWQLSGEGVGWLLALIDAFIADAEALQSRSAGNAPSPGALRLAARLAAKGARPGATRKAGDAEP